MMAPDDARELLAAYERAREAFVDAHLLAEAAGALPHEDRNCTLALIAARRAEYNLRVVALGHDSLTREA